MRIRNNKISRYTILIFLFVSVCLVFVARLVNLQFNPFKTAELRAESKYTIETKTIQALRGDICDRNGNVLVTTSFAYDIIIDYNAMPDSFKDFNRTLLTALDLINKTQSDVYRPSDLFPFVGEYPNYEYSEEAKTEGDATYNALQKLLKELNMKDKSAKELTEYFVKRWKLSINYLVIIFIFSNNFIANFILAKFYYASQAPFVILLAVNMQNAFV